MIKVWTLKGFWGITEFISECEEDTSHMQHWGQYGKSEPSLEIWGRRRVGRNVTRVRLHRPEGVKWGRDFEEWAPARQDHFLLWKIDY